MILSKMFAKLTATLAIAGITIITSSNTVLAQNFNPSDMCCHINNLRATQNKPALRYMPCANSVSNLNSQLQATAGRQGHFVGDTGSLVGRTCGSARVGYSSQVAGGSSFWKDTASMVKAWYDEPIHRALLFADNVNACSSAMVPGNGGVPYYTADLFQITGALTGSLPMPSCNPVQQAIGAIAQNVVPNVVPAMPNVVPTVVRQV
ncbi:hypothetical protein GQ42DRAFT_156875 [Ramicandelaber brevisporus]|nr:hypothetical protein GQ42DRAFT_172492 [Ramicandelaber brevisporus]KAI8868656.1 hypothetical protein GQ42DRAFT_156875 [Ramicandelaber brevisporus]